MEARLTPVVLAFGVAVLGGWGVASSHKTSTPASAEATSAGESHAVPADVAAAGSEAPRFARARIVVKGAIDESRFATLQVEVVERRANGQMTLLIPADRLDAFRSLPGNYTTRISTPATAL